MLFLADSRFQFCVTRLIELSKKQMLTRDALIGTPGSSVGDAFQISFSQLFYISQCLFVKFGAAQVELHAWEAHLAAKEEELLLERQQIVCGGGGDFLLSPSFCHYLTHAWLHLTSGTPKPGSGAIPGPSGLSALP